MKAIVKKYEKPGVWMDEVPMPNVGINDVLIKIRKTSICGTDAHIYEYNDWARRAIKVPMVIGHEFVGEVAGFGDNVKDFTIGELVSGEGHLICGLCRNCLAGRRHLCKETMGVGVDRMGAFAEYLCIPASNVWHCDSSIPEEIFSLFDPFGNAVHTALAFDVLCEDVIVTGAGSIGIMAAAAAMHAGARHVVITDINPYRLKLAERMGIKHRVNPIETSIEDIKRELGIKEGFDVGLEMSGSAAAFNNLVDNMCHGGKIAVLGMQPRGTAIDWDKLVFNSLTIKGIYGREMFETWYKMTMLIKTGLDISPIITHRFDADDYLDGFKAMAEGTSGKVILNWVK